MEETLLLEALVELARETGLSVQRLPRQPLYEGQPPSPSGSCRVRGEVRVLLSDSDPLPTRIQVLARTLRRTRGEALEGRFLPPALREALEGAEPSCAPET
jgi:hypothetical protein